MIENITHNSINLAIIIRASFQKEGIQFFTPDNYTQQLAYMNRPAGYVIQPHLHNPVKREVEFTKEVIFIKSGMVRVDFYDESQKYLQSTVLKQGDVILLAYGGHGFEILENCEMIEVKQGPYAGEQDKTRFAPVDSNKIKFGDFK
jgi:mannose-6-phosphate isomerase-like protein (cupin superfamily)